MTCSLSPSLPPPSILVLRLSSLGDVILATAALPALQNRGRVSWVVAEEFACLLEGHPGIAHVIPFRRGQGLRGWLELCRSLASQDYSEIVDLHRTLRTRIFRWVFLWERIKAMLRGERSPFVNPQWRFFSKARFRLYGYFLFKKFWPAAWRPPSVIQRVRETVGAMSSDSPDLSHLARSSHPALMELPDGYFCVMPSSKWPGKNWGAERFAEALKSLNTPIVVLGSQADTESTRLFRILAAAGKQVVSGVGNWSLPEVAWVLRHSKGLLSNDTGMVHLAESMGVRVQVIFGATQPDMGFGPWRKQSMVHRTPVFCSPCGKDGRYCYRIGDRYGCFKLISPGQVERELQKWEHS